MLRNIFLISNKTRAGLLRRVLRPLRTSVKYTWKSSPYFGFRTLIWFWLTELSLTFIGWALVTAIVTMGWTLYSQPEVTATALVLTGLSSLEHSFSDVSNVILELITEDKVSFWSWFKLSIVGPSIWFTAMANAIYQDTQLLVDVLPQINLLEVSQWQIYFGFISGVFYNYGIEPIWTLIKLPWDIFWNTGINMSNLELITEHLWIKHLINTYRDILVCFISDYTLLWDGIGPDDYARSARPSTYEDCLLSRDNPFNPWDLSDPFEDKESPRTQHSNYFLEEDDPRRIPLPATTSSESDYLDYTDERWELINDQPTKPRSYLNRSWMFVKGHPYLFGTIVVQLGLKLIPVVASSAIKSAINILW